MVAFIPAPCIVICGLLLGISTFSLQSAIAESQSPSFEQIIQLYSIGMEGLREDLLVNAGSDLDDGALLTIFRHSVHSGLHGDEVATPTGIHAEEVGYVPGRRW